MPEKLTQDTYRIKDELQYSIDILEFDIKNMKWKPYVANDIQMEYVMMNPYYRLQLYPVSPGSKTYLTTFHVN